MQANDLVNELIDLRNTPQEDAGDVTIDVQDDMPLVTVTQRGVMIGIGDSINEALQDAINNVRADHNPRDPLGRMEVEYTSFSESGCLFCGCECQDEETDCVCNKKAAS